MTVIPSNARRESWDGIHGITIELSKLIEQHCAQSGERFDAIVVVPRGSYYPVNIISRRLGFKSIDLLHASVASYESGKTDRKAEFELGQMPSDEEVAGKNLLIIDEVCDTGHTLKFLVDRLKGQGAELVRTGTLHYKPGQNQVGFKPDWHVVETDEWIVYPWEEHEVGDDASVKRSSDS